MPLQSFVDNNLPTIKAAWLNAVDAFYFTLFNSATTAAGARTAIDVPSNAETVLKTIVDAKGDILAGTAADTLARVAVGTDGQVLTADAASTPGIKWAAGGSGLSVATQAEQEAASSLTVAVPPGRQHFHPSAVKAWAEFDGTGTPAFRAAYNFTSITDNGTGDYTLNFTTAMSGVSYCALVSVLGAGVGSAVRVATITSKTTAGVRLAVGGVDATGSFVSVDLTFIYVAVFGDM